MRSARHFPRIVLFACLLLPIAALPASAAVYWDWQAEGTPETLSSLADFDRLLQSATWHTETAGQPSLPIEPLSLAIPAGERVAAVRIVNPVVETYELQGALPLYQGALDDHGELSIVRDGSGGLRFPESHIYAFGTNVQRGIASAAILIAPVIVERSMTSTLVHRLVGGQIVVETESDFTAVLPMRQTAADKARSLGGAAARVANPEMLPGFVPQSSLRIDDGLFEPRGLPSIEGSGVDMVIICSAAHASILADLAAYKNSIGIATVVRDLDWIQANYPQGADLQETIRFFVRDAFEKWGIRFLLLAGDTAVIPARYILSYFKSPPELVPTDLYYAQLDGNFNADGDSYFGEPPFAGEPGDLIDFVADINVGRLPIETVAEAQLMVTKILNYSSAPDTSYTRKMALLGEVLFPADYDTLGGFPDEVITRNGADYCEDLKNDYIDVLTPQLEPYRWYETPWMFSGWGLWSEWVNDVLNDMDTRAHMVHHVGHGFRYTMSCGTGSIVANQIFNLNNGLDHLIVFYALNCTSCAIDFDCLGEAFLRAPNGGGVASIGTIREAYPNTSLYYMNSYYRYALSDTLSLGESFTESHNEHATLAIIEGTHRYTQYTYVLIGDPSINLWLDTPMPLEVALSEPFSLDSDTLHLAITRDALPLDSALVIAYKEGEDRAEGYCDANGLISLPVHAESLGDMQLSVISRNNLPYFGVIPVDPAVGPRLSVGGLTVLDDPIDAAVSGNNDARLDGGETVRLGLTVYNHGGAAADNFSLDIAAPGGELLVLESGYTGGETIAAGDSLVLVDVFLLGAPLDLGDGLAAIVDFTLGHGAGESQQDQLDIATHSPAPALFSFTVDDQGGDGDGEPDDGETYSLSPEWKNYGSTPLGSDWQASLAAVDPAGTVHTGLANLPDLDLLERGFSPGFLITESDVSSPNRFELTISGPLGHSFVDTIVVRRPIAPTNFVLDSSSASTVINMGWDIPPGDSVIDGYLVYRSEVEGGPYQQVNSEPTRHAYFQNAGLMESSIYYFVVETVDDSGYRSEPSLESAAATSPGMQAGWPIEVDLALGGGSAGSVAIGDITGDGVKDIIVPNRYIYAWHHDGTEIVDGDGNSSTYGVLNSEGLDFKSSIVLAQVDTFSTGLEVIAASETPYAMHVFRSNGQELPGWPKSMPHWSWSTPAAADIDGDGFIEIFTACLDGNVYAWHHTGVEVLDGDNDPATDGVFATGLTSWSRSSVSLVQLDGDPELEIVVGSNDANKLFAWNHDGTELPGFPISFELEGEGMEIHSSPSIGDVDGDGDNEIVFLCENDSLYIIQGDGSNFPGFPVALVSNTDGLCSSPALFDIEDDGQLEIVAWGTVNYTNSYLTVIDNTGTTLPGWPIYLTTSAQTSPIVVDIDNDDELEILIGSEAGILFGFEMDGTPISGFPFVLGSEIRGTPTVGDIDDDYDLDIGLMTWDGKVYIWDLPSFYQNGMAQWKMFRGNSARTGAVSREEQVVGVEEDSPVFPEGKIFANYPNPFNPSTRIRFATPEGEGQVNVTLSIHDVNGRRVTTLQAGPMQSGTTHSIVWDGKDEAGSGVASGVYFSRLEMGEAVLSSKMVLLK